VTLQKLFLTLFGAGMSPKSPKTAGTLVALVVGLAILNFLGMETLFMMTVAVIIIGIFEINKYQRLTEETNRQEIVIDEAAGMWMSLMITLSTAATINHPFTNILAIILSIASFRLFEIWQPSTIGWINREIQGGLGMMMRSVLSGIAGGLLSVVVLMGLRTLL